MDATMRLAPRTSHTVGVPPRMRSRVLRMEVPLPARVALRRGCERDPERFEVRRHARRQQADLLEVPDKRGGQVAPEELAERGLVPARRALAAQALDLV